MINLTKIFPLLFLFSVSLISDEKMNVLIILADDQGFGDMSCHGHPFIKTPSLDSLQKQSVSFTDFHVAPYCSPTRASIMTGRMPDKTGVLRTYSHLTNLSQKETIMPQFFKSSGYMTAMIGKWHLGADYPFRPIDRGFDHWFGFGTVGQRSASDFWGNDRFDDTYINNGKYEKREGFCTDIYFAEAIDFMSKAKENNKPFFIYLATSVPHYDWNVKKEWLKSQQGVTREQSMFYASVERVDLNIGKILKYLENNELDKNTIVLFLTDNGSDCPGNAYSAGMRGKKASMYEGGHRVPLFIKAPNQLIGPPRTIDSLTAGFDILPTLIELCKLPQLKHEPWDGLSMVQLFQKSPQWPEREIILHFNNKNEIPQRMPADSVLMTSKWRLINQQELYDIKNDPAQKKNLKDTYPDVFNSLLSNYKKHCDELKMDKMNFSFPILSKAGLWLTYDLSTTNAKWPQEVALIGEKLMTSWNFHVTDNTKAQFKVRRWSRELSVPMTAKLPASYIDPEIEYSFKPAKEGKALPIHAVRLQLSNGTDLTKELSAGAESVDFEVDLHKGEIICKAFYLDSEGTIISGAYYIEISQKD